MGGSFLSWWLWLSEHINVWGLEKKDLRFES